MQDWRPPTGLLARPSLDPRLLAYLRTLGDKFENYCLESHVSCCKELWRDR